MEIEILPYSLRFGLEDCENSEVESQDVFKIVAGYFLLSLAFFCSLHCRSLCRITPNKNEADFPHSDKKHGVCSCMCSYMF